ncbi:peptidylprolyl isomerase [Ideonella paludis]|uniref:Chaperone SurA n=1 Tax=Ideonella paludis TaxID=1233411 RepID=A0ABS5DS98_9BURK|nr:peptidylprolyl isomerase [Ideonella paludis]MBQ0934028.1 peptidylprolyl isomerase [Ideonella paludis]
MTTLASRLRRFGLATLLAVPVAVALAQTTPRSADFIVAVVNNELVTRNEVDQRIAELREQARRSNAKLPADAQLRKEVVEALINERVIITYARDSGMKVDEAELDRAVANVAAANKMSVDVLRERLKAEGLDMTRFRNNLRDQILAERTREREVQGRLRISDADVERFIEEQAAQRGRVATLNLAQILVTVPEGASREVENQRRARAEEVQRRLLAGEAFDKLARQYSEDGNRERGGEIGAKPQDKLPDLFVEAVQSVPVGGVTPKLIRSGAGFHLIKVLSRSDGSEVTVTQTRARHILLRPSVRLSPEAAKRRLAEFREAVVTGKASFEELARKNSEDGSATSGGDLGWANPGQFVPEFEEAMGRLQLGGISPPIESRFGFHLIQVTDRRDVPMDPKQVREQARNVLREQRYESTYTEWINELRSRAYVEMREAPQ